MTIMLVDIADFTNPVRTAAHQKVMHEGMYEVLERAFDESAIPWRLRDVHDRGDGAMILLQSQVDKIKLVDRLPNRLVAGLRRFNALHAAEAAIQLRVALHFGEVQQNKSGIDSPAVNFTFRIVEAEEAKAALRGSTAVVAYIASDPFYREVIAGDPATFPAAYRRIPVEVKNERTEVWLRLPDQQPMGPGIAEEGQRSPQPQSREDVLVPWPARALERLSELLAGVSVRHVPTIVRRAAGSSVPVPSTDSAWDIFLDLTDVNAEPDGIPPALLFLDLLCDQLDAGLESRLTEWISSQATQLRLESALQVRRKQAAPIPAAPRLYLMIALEQDGIDPASYRLSYWRQDDPDTWPPPRLDGGETTEDQVEYQVDRVVVAAEEEWADQTATVALEFVLPRTLMHLPVHQWSKEHESGNPRPLCLDYPIVLRSLERMISPRWHRVWRDRWRSLLQDPSAARVHFCSATDTGAAHRIDAALSDPQWVSAVLSVPPGPESNPGLDELTAALQSGMPIVIWHPEASADDLRRIVGLLANQGSLADLPARTHASRRESIQGLASANGVRNLVLLWDDPNRLVVFGRPPMHQRPQEHLR